MPDTIIFDTHRYVKSLTEAGITPTAAEAIANGQVQLLENNLATKHDIELLRADMNALALQTKNDLIKWIVGTMSGTILSFVALVIAVLQFLP